MLKFAGIRAGIKKESSMEDNHARIALMKTGNRFPSIPSRQLPRVELTSHPTCGASRNSQLFATLAKERRRNASVISLCSKCRFRRHRLANFADSSPRCASTGLFGACFTADTWTTSNIYVHRDREREREREYDICIKYY